MLHPGLRHGTLPTVGAASVSIAAVLITRRVKRHLATLHDVQVRLQDRLQAYQTLFFLPVGVTRHRLDTGQFTPVAQRLTGLHRHAGVAAAATAGQVLHPEDGAVDVVDLVLGRRVVHRNVQPGSA